MKAFVIYEPGGPEKLIYTEVPTPEIKDGWSLVKIQGFGVNHSEIFTRKGQSPSVKFPRILGIECVGTIEKTSDEKRFPIGKQVVSIMGEMGRAFDGGYAEYVLLPNEQIYTVNTRLPIEELVAAPETYYTAYASMLNLQIMESDKILVRGATSGVGIAFLKLVKGKFPNACVVGTSRSEEKGRRLLNEGFDDIIIDKNNVLQGNKNFDKVLDLIGPAALKNTFIHMNSGAIVCCTGILGGVWALDSFDPLEDLPENAYLTSFHSGNVNERKLQDMFDYISRYNISVKPERIFSFKDTPKAHEYLESAQSFGKTVVLL